jgi:hypothetical protein
MTHSARALRTIHAAVRSGAARGDILEGLSVHDMQTLSDHMNAGTLMSGITPLVGATSKAAAVRAMPPDLGRVVAKIPAEKVAALRGHLQTLGRDHNNDVVCGC